MKRVLLLALVLTVGAATAAGQAPPGAQQTGPEDVNVTAATAAAASITDARARAIFDQLVGGSFVPPPPEPGTLCAIAVLPGPGTSFNIRLGVFNVINESLDFLIMDSFTALNGESLLHQSVFAVTPPPSGTATVEYPPGTAGVGPVVMSFTSFGLFDSSSFNTDPDTYDNAAFGATVEDMNNTLLEAVYGSEVAGGARCSGSLFFVPVFDASIAFLTQQ